MYIHNHCRIANSALNNSKSEIPLIFNDFKVFSSASDKAKLFAGLVCGPCIFRILGRILHRKATTLLVFFLRLVKSLKNL